MTLLRVDASIQGDRSASSALADLIIGQITSAQPQIAVVHRHLGEDPLPATAWAAAGVGSHTPEADRTPAHRQALELASQVATELQEATSAVLAMPLHNYGHNVDYLRRILVDTWNADLTLVGRDVTLVGVNPGPRRRHRPRRPDAPDREPRSHGRGHRAHRSLRRLTAEPAKQR